jgi:hypothetical protein
MVRDCDLRVRATSPIQRRLTLTSVRRVQRVDLGVGRRLSEHHERGSRSRGARLADLCTGGTDLASRLVTDQRCATRRLLLRAASVELSSSSLSLTLLTNRAHLGEGPPYGEGTTNSAQRRKHGCYKGHDLILTNSSMSAPSGRNAFLYASSSNPSIFIHLVPAAKPTST